MTICDNQAQITGRGSVKPRIVDFIQNAVVNVNQTRLLEFRDVPTPLLALEVQRGVDPGQPEA